VKSLHKVQVHEAHCSSKRQRNQSETLTLSVPN
jgi:hypothetical protein